MSENKYSFRNEIKFGKQKEKEERALKDFGRNRLGLYLSAVVFFIVLLTTLSGIVLNRNLMMILLVVSYSYYTHLKMFRIFNNQSQICSLLYLLACNQPHI